MRLFLVSSKLSDSPEKLLELMGTGRNVLYILNADDRKTSFKRLLKKIRTAFKFLKLGARSKELDLRKFFGKSKLLEEFIKNYAPDLIFAQGGNTFTLRKAYRLSGFDEILKRDLLRDKYVYGGGSAGAIITCPDLKLYENPDDIPTEPTKGYPKKPIFEGLNLISEYLVPHADADWFIEDAKQIAQKLKKAGKKVRMLKDNDYYIVNKSLS